MCFTTAGQCFVQLVAYRCVFVLCVKFSSLPDAHVCMNYANNYCHLYIHMKALLELLSTLRQKESEGVETHCIHFTETGTSVLHEYPYIVVRDYRVRANETCVLCVCMLLPLLLLLSNHQGQEPGLDFTQAMMTCQKSVLNADDFSCINLVYGEAGISSCVQQ